MYYGTSWMDLAAAGTSRFGTSAGKPSPGGISASTCPNLWTRLTSGLQKPPTQIPR